MMDWLLVGSIGKVMVGFMDKVVMESKVMVWVRLKGMESMCSTGKVVWFLGNLVAMRFMGMVLVRLLDMSSVVKVLG